MIGKLVRSMPLPVSENTKLSLSVGLLIAVLSGGVTVTWKTASFWFELKSKQEQIEARMDLQDRQIKALWERVSAKDQVKKRP